MSNLGNWGRHLEAIAGDFSDPFKYQQPKSSNQNQAIKIKQSKLSNHNQAIKIKIIRPETLI